MIQLSYLVERIRGRHEGEEGHLTRLVTDDIGLAGAVGFDFGSWYLLPAAGRRPVFP